MGVPAIVEALKNKNIECKIYTKDKDYLTSSTKQAKVNELERQIDQLVYELYGLTDEEITVVEGTAK